jgi:DNA polymerase-3 subunit delta'
MQQPDLSIVQCEEDASLIKVEQVRTLQHALSLSPYEARYRIALLLNFEQATPSAQNALLKTLEEAPQYVVLLLTAESSESLLPTIVSRCEVLRLRPAAIAPLENGLTDRWGYPADEARLLAHLSGGRTGYAVHLHDHPELLAQREAWLQDLGELLGQPVRLRFAWVEKNYKRPDKNELRLIFQTWLSFWRDLLLCAAGSSAPLTNLDHADDIRRLAQRIALPEALASAAALEQALARLDANANTRLVLDNVVLDWPLVQS